MTNNTNNQMTLWSFGQPAQDLAKFLDMKESKRDDGTLKAVSVTLSNRKSLASALNLTGKANKDALNTKIREMRDDMKGQFGKEVIAIVQSQAWTGGSARKSRSKNGDEIVKFSFVKMAGSNENPIETHLKALLKAGVINDEQFKTMLAQAIPAAAVDVAATSVPQPESSAVTDVTPAPMQ